MLAWGIPSSAVLTAMLGAFAAVGIQTGAKPSVTRIDRHGDSLPLSAVAPLGTSRPTFPGNRVQVVTVSPAAPAIQRPRLAAAGAGLFTGRPPAGLRQYRHDHLDLGRLGHC